MDWPRTILVADDATPEAEATVDAAVDIALATGARLSLVHVKNTSNYVVGATASEPMHERLRAEGETFLAQRLEQVRLRGCEIDRHWLRLARSIEREIVRVVENEGFDLLVVPRRGQTYPQRRALGDLSLHLVRDAPCSVLVVRSSHLPPRRRLATAEEPSTKRGDQ